MARRRPTEPTVNPARGVALVVVAVVVGLLLLRNGLDTSEVITASKGDSSQKTDSGNGEGDTSTTTTIPARDPSTVTVIVLNGTSVSGAAGKYTTAIASAGYQMLDPGDATTKIPATQVFYAFGFEREAAAVAASAGAPSSLTPTAMPTPPPGEVGAANVVVVIGTDLASLTPTTTPTTAPAASSTTVP